VETVVGFNVKCKFLVEFEFRIQLNLNSPFNWDAGMRNHLSISGRVGVSIDRPGQHWKPKKSFSKLKPACARVQPINSVGRDRATMALVKVAVIYYSQK
jgi:hypothetical protein